MSKIATLVGVLTGLLIVVLNMFDFSTGQFLSAFVNPQGLLVVLGGTLAATLINYPLNDFRCVGSGLKRVFVAEPPSATDAITEINELSYIAFRHGTLQLEKEIELVEDGFLQFALNELLVYRDYEQLKLSLDNHYNTIRLRHLNCQEMFHNMASYAPAFGMMGTVMGLIIMMTTQVATGEATAVGADSENMLNSLLQGMGLALVTTFYGVLFANFVFVPVAGKLKVLSDAEALKNEILMHGVLGIHKNVSPAMLKETLTAFVNERNKARLAQDLNGSVDS